MPQLVVSECPECGPTYAAKNPLRGVYRESSKWRLDKESQALVDAHRERKGWPT